MSAPDGPVHRAYILFDTSGSTVRGGFAVGRDQAMPMLIDTAMAYPDLRLAVLGYGTVANTLIWLSDPADIKLIPAIVPAGLSSLAAGFRLLADMVRDDAIRLAADGIACLAPKVLIVADGLPTDPADVLLAARDEFDAAITYPDAGNTLGTEPCVPVFAVLPDADSLAVAGLRMSCQPLATDTPADLAASIVAAFAQLIGG